MDIYLHKGALKTDGTGVSNAECLVVPVLASAASSTSRMSGDLATLDKLSDGAIRRVLDQGDFKGRAGNVAMLPELPGLAKRTLLAGLGSEPIDEPTFDRMVRAIFKSVGATTAKQAAIVFGEVVVQERDIAWQLQHLALCAEYENYRYTETRTTKQTYQPLNRLDIYGVENTIANQQAVKRGLAIAAGTNTARKLGDLPANICTPTYLGETAQTLAKDLPNTEVRVLNEKKLRSMKMNTLLSVSRGSIEPPCVIVMEYQGAGKKTAPIALVGKGVSFDTGGISIKPSGAMDEMKYDMCGAASVIGAVEAAARMALPINIVGVVGAVENMPSDRATKPGDVITSMSGKTVEILNTDAEGRLVLCDLLHYVKEYKPSYIVDIATLTGACLVALGKHACGLFSNNDGLSERLVNAGNTSVDRAWQLPMWPEYKKELHSNFADLANIGGRYAGSVTAACFLYEFVGKDWAWAHLDIAGVAWRTGMAKGGTGRPVPLLSQFLIDI